MSEPYSLLVVGGGPAGLSAARAYRDAGGDGTVAIVADEGRMPYRRPPLTKELLRGESAETDLPLEEEGWLDEQAWTSSPGARSPWTPAGVTCSCRVAASSGTRPACWPPAPSPPACPVPGADRPWVHVVRTVEHVRRLTARLRRARPRGGDRVGLHRMRDRRLAARPRPSRRARQRRAAAQQRASRRPAGPDRAGLADRGRRDHPPRSVGGAHRACRRRARGQHRCAATGGRRRGDGDRRGAALRAGRPGGPGARRWRGPGERRDAHRATMACWPPGTSAWPRISPPAGRCGSSTGVTRWARARSRARRRPASTRAGTRFRDSGRRSARVRSSTRRGATDSTPHGCTVTTMALSSPGTAGRARSRASSPTSTTTTTSAGAS